VGVDGGVEIVGKGKRAGAVGVAGAQPINAAHRLKHSHKNRIFMIIHFHHYQSTS
jgi:hypothetical protein